MCHIIRKMIKRLCEDSMWRVYLESVQEVLWTILKYSMSGEVLRVL
jgi:hypothetical protein